MVVKGIKEDETRLLFRGKNPENGLFQKYFAVGKKIHGKTPGKSVFFLLIDVLFSYYSFVLHLLSF